MSTIRPTLRETLLSFIESTDLTTSNDQQQLQWTPNPQARSYWPSPSASDKFSQAAGTLQTIQTIFQSTRQEDLNELVDNYIVFISDSMCEAIYTSNFVQGTGLDFTQTRTLCKLVFDGHEVNPTAVRPHTPLYARTLSYLRRNRNITRRSIHNFTRARREVIQHAEAFLYLVDQMLNKETEITEEILKQTHSILYHNIAEPQYYAGTLRTIDTLGDDISHPPHTTVPTWTSRLLQSINANMNSIRTSGQLDPFFLAASTYRDIVTVSPFNAGNAQVGRLLMNTYLIQYVGVVVGVGAREEEKERHVSLLKKGRGMMMEREEEARGDLAEWVLGRGVASLRRLKGKLREVEREIVAERE